MELNDAFVFESYYIYIPRISLFSHENDFFSLTNCFYCKRRQFPVKLAFAMTINKSQGQTIKKAGLFLESNIFTHGKLYTALSNVLDRMSIKILTKK